MPLHIQERNIRDIVIMDLYGNLDFNTAPEATLSNSRSNSRRIKGSSIFL